MWELNRLDSINGIKIENISPVSDQFSESQFPGIIETPFGKALLFDGINDGILVKGNPLEGAQEFTIEILFRPDSSSAKTNFEQRFFHLRNKLNDDRRILIELRLLSNNSWSLDTFVKSENSRCTLFDSTKFSHPVGPWYHIALVYENGIMKHYVNGTLELSGNVNYVPIDNGQISIGARMDPRSWFKGAISKIRFTQKALQTSQFTFLLTNEILK